MGMKDAAERLFVRIFSSPRASRVTGRLADARVPKVLLGPVMRAYIRAYRVDAVGEPGRRLVVGEQLAQPVRASLDLLEAAVGRDATDRHHPRIAG